MNKPEYVSVEFLKILKDLLEIPFGYGPNGRISITRAYQLIYEERR